MFFFVKIKGATKSSHLISSCTQNTQEESVRTSVHLTLGSLRQSQLNALKEGHTIVLREIVSSSN